MSRARSTSSALCVSTSGVMPSSMISVVQLASVGWSSAATMSSTRSAPAARASSTWYGVGDEVLAQHREATAARTASRSASDPPNLRPSVSTLIALAPPVS